MGAKLIRGMGGFFKTCPCTRQNRCPHPHGIRFRDAAGQQREEGGYATQQDALDRLTKLYNEKHATVPQQAVLKRETGKQRFGEYSSSWLARQRHYAPGQVIIPTLDELHALKAVASDGLRLVIDLMSGCGLRNGEAYDVYRITEQKRDTALRERLANRWSRWPPKHPQEDRMLALAVADALEKLPPGQRQVLTLRFYADLTVRDIAGLLDIPEGTVKSRLHTAMGAMRARLSTQEVI
ncbi:RNA polymerase sigma factor [Streptomyces sp. NPDC055749]